jgi:urease accessory protein
VAASQIRFTADEALIQVHHVLGNAADKAWRDRVGRARVDALRLDQAEAQKSRLRKRTEGGNEIALALDRGVRVRDGDVLAVNEAKNTVVVARVDLDDVLVIDLSGLLAASAQDLVTGCVELGHAIGNQHWPAVIKGPHVYVPLTVDKAVMASVMTTHGFEGVSFWFEPGAEVIPHLAPHEARRLFGAAGGHQHGGHQHGGQQHSGPDTAP